VPRNTAYAVTVLRSSSTVVARLLTYDVRLNRECAAYCRAIMKWPAMAEWVMDAKAEPADIEELDMEF